MDKSKGIVAGKIKNPVFIIFLALVALFSFISYAHEAIKMPLFNNFGDFGSYYFFSKAMRLNYNVYTLDTLTKGQLRQEFKMPEFISGYIGHSPAFLFLFQGFTFFEYRQAAFIWFILNHLLLLFALWIILKLVFKETRIADRPYIILGSIFLVFSFQPLIENTAIGQINLAIFFFLACCLYFLAQKKLILSGIMLSLATFIKPQPGVLFLFFLWKGCYRVFFSALFFFIALEISPILLGNVNLEADYWRVVVHFFNMYAYSMSMAGLSFGTLVNRMVNLSAHPEAIGLCLSISFIFTLALFIYSAYITKGKLKKFNSKSVLEFSLALMFILATFSVVHEHHYVFLYLPIIFIWAELVKEAKPAPAVFFIISYLLIGLKYSLTRFPIFSSGIWSIFSGLKLYGVLILFYLAAYLIQQKTRESQL